MTTLSGIGDISEGCHHGAHESCAGGRRRWLVVVPGPAIADDEYVNVEDTLVSSDEVCLMLDGDIEHVGFI